MKRKMAAIMIAATICCLLAACGSSNSPSATAKTLFEAIKAFDVKKMQSCLLTPGESSDISELESNSMSNVMIKSWKEWASKLEYTIAETKAEGDTAFVTVNCKYVDASAVTAAAISAYMLKAIGVALSGGSQDSLDSLLTECFEDAIKTADIQMAEEKVTLEMVKSGNDWKVKSLPNEVIHIFTSNSIKSLQKLSDAFSSSSDTPTTEAPTTETPTTEAPTTAPTTEAALTEVGYWIMTHYKSKDKDLDEATLRKYEEASGFKAFIVFEANGFGYLNVFGTEQDFTWEKGDAGGLSYTFDNETMVLKDATTEFVFVRSSGTAPARGTLVDKP